MTDSKESENAERRALFTLNPDYGGGAFHRRIRLTRESGRVLGELEDCNHGFKVKVFHEDGVVTEIRPEFPRVPFTSCPSSEMAIRGLLGARVDLPAKDLNAIVNPLANCTHLLDLSVLCITHTQCVEDIVQYDVEITDQVEGIAHSRVWRNGELMHHWKSQAGLVIWPESLRGKPVQKGFSSWANLEFSGLAHEAAFVLHKGHLVSVGRFMNFDGMAGNRAIDESDHNVCFTYSAEQAAEAIRLSGTVREFFEDPDSLLKFR